MERFSNFVISFSLALTIFFFFFSEKHAECGHNSKTVGGLSKNTFGTATSGQICSSSKTRHRQPLKTNRKLYISKFISKKTHIRKWGVVSTIFSPSISIVRISNLPGWCVVVVLDKKSDPNFEALLKDKQSGCVRTLTVNDQVQLPYLSSKNLPWNHFSRKNIGFLYAIENGAREIYDFDDDNFLLPIGFPEYNYTSIRCPVEYARIFNPYPSFGSNSWPRGLPLESIKDRKTYISNADCLQTETFTNIYVLQSLANIEPDFDAIFRLTRTTPVHFQSGEPVVLSAGTFAPYNAQATLFQYDSFWSLFLPTTVHGRVSDIWRSYFSQPIFWILGGKVAFSSPFVEQFRNAHKYIADFSAEDDLYKKAQCLIDYLFDWWKMFQKGSSSVSSVPELFLDLLMGAYEREMIEWKDVELYRDFMDDLALIGYKFPSVHLNFKLSTLEKKKKISLAYCWIGNPVVFDFTMLNHLYHLSYFTQLTFHTFAAFRFPPRNANNFDFYVDEEAPSTLFHIAGFKSHKVLNHSDKYERKFGNVLFIRECQDMIKKYQSKENIFYDNILVADAEFAYVAKTTHAYRQEHIVSELDQKKTSLYSLHSANHESVLYFGKSSTMLSLFTSSATMSDRNSDIIELSDLEFCKVSKTKDGKGLCLSGNDSSVPFFSNVREEMIEP